MSGFKKAKAEQAALKAGIYGPPGSGKTLTSLMLLEGLAKATGKRFAYVDTEHGTDFYCKTVPSRAVHPEAFDFDAIYTRSLTEVLAAVKELDPNEYGAIGLDSITHLWEAARGAYSGKVTSVGSIPMHAWGKIKKPYKELISILLSSPMHVIICGRQGVEYETNEETEELRAIGLKMKAEGETPYEPHILIRMEIIKPKKTNEIAQIVAYVEKDRTGVLAGRSFVNPNFDTLAKPLLHLLGTTQAQMPTDDFIASVDAEALFEEERLRAVASGEHLRKFKARLDLANTHDELKKIGKEITPELKSQMITHDVTQLREAYQKREQDLKAVTA